MLLKTLLVITVARVTLTESLANIDQTLINGRIRLTGFDSLKEKVNEGIEELRRAKAKAEKHEKENNSLASLAEEISRDGGEFELMSKMDLLYDNHSDLARELKFVPFTYNCGKDFDIYKVLELVKSHSNITTEEPKCIEDLEKACAKSGTFLNSNSSSMSVPNSTATTVNIGFISTARRMIVTTSGSLPLQTLKDVKKPPDISRPLTSQLANLTNSNNNNNNKTQKIVPAVKSDIKQTTSRIINHVDIQQSLSNHVEPLLNPKIKTNEKIEKMKSFEALRNKVEDGNISAEHQVLAGSNSQWKQEYNQTHR